MHKLQELVRLYRNGVPATKIATTLKLDRKTERKYRRRIDSAGLLEGPADDLPPLAALRDATRRVSSIPKQERSSVEEYRSFIEEKLKQGLKPTAIHELLQENRTSFEGSLSSVKRMYSRIRKEVGPRSEDVAILVHTAAGDQAQVDFGYVGKLHDPKTKRERKAWVFVMVLSHSRMIFAKVVERNRCAVAEQSSKKEPLPEFR